MDIYLSTKDYAHTGESFDLVKHPKWKMLMTTPQPRKLQRYYDGDYISHTDDSRGFVEAIYYLAKRWSMYRKVRWLKKYAGKGDRLFDIGSGTGDFLLAAERYGWKAAGTEPNKAARSRAREKGLEVKAKLSEVEGRAHVVTLWHVLEHLPDLEQSVDEILSRILPGGTLVIALPNYCSWDAGYYGKYWAAYDVPRHLWHFSKQAVHSIFEERGWKVVEIRPMWLDAFYIALLSERYSESRFAIPKAVWNGCRSNLAALRSGEYSSLAYVLKKDVNLK